MYMYMRAFTCPKRCWCCCVVCLCHICPQACLPNCLPARPLACLTAPLLLGSLCAPVCIHAPNIAFPNIRAHLSEVNTLFNRLI